ncbi:glycerol-3-phosphate acyltransferase [Paenibacillus sp. LHD-117]|uniref:glycerol-3-phosphate acyltransferase n=1 Tax=Paenibacillus sp. LHD-117 TaxID=3071412 RepID=UPI0027DEED95|nr:glycerol-3-phosphate acyltransferase [Paenibacillus sp. LHD-117]MDQ6422412.1 glycerol-3-phosphate acyltransferase [Paenibacillus sp. LHD-117]
MTILTYAAWTAFCFLCGSLMFSYWIGLFANKNVREHGDGNPGALNLWKAAGFGYGLAGIAFDSLKGYVPVLLLVHSGQAAGYGLVLPSAAALLGHMFSPFLRGKGGKAIAVTFGVWSALTGFAATLAYAVILALLLLGGRLIRSGKPSTPRADGFQVVLGMLLLTVCVLVFGGSDALPLAAFGLVNFLLLAYAHRRELRALIRIKRLG